MDILLVAFASALGGVIGGGVVSLLIIYLSESQRKKHLWTALYNEIKLNHTILQSIGFAGMHIKAYENILASGELISLDPNLFSKLASTYKKIYEITMDVTRGVAIYNPNLANSLSKELKHLIEVLPKSVKALRKQESI